MKAPWIAVELLGGQSRRRLQKWVYRLFIFYLFIFSRAGSVCFASGYEFVEGASYLKARKLDAGGNFFQNTWHSIAGFSYVMIFHLDPIRV